MEYDVVWKTPCNVNGLIVALGFAGRSLHADHSALDPHVPAAWQSLRFGLQWRGRHLRVGIIRATVTLEVTLNAGEPMTVVVSGKAFELSRARAFSVATDSDSG